MVISELIITEWLIPRSSMTIQLEYTIRSNENEEKVDIDSRKVNINFIQT